MKHLLSILLISSTFLFSIVTNDGATLTIDNDVTVTIDGSFSNSGSVINEGVLNINGYYDHNAGVGTDSGSGVFSLCDDPKDLHSGANLISFYALPENDSISNVMSSIEGVATGVIGEGVASSYIEDNGWIGSLSNISPTSGYWVIVDESCELSLCDAVLTPPVTEYNLHTGANLISFLSFGNIDIGASIPDDVEDYITGIIGEGVATTNNGGEWMGSLSKFYGGKGYWVKTTEDISFSFELNTLQRKSSNNYTKEKLDGYEYNQSSKQAFYFIESVENIEVGDWLLSFNGDKIIGSRQWQGYTTDLPAMGDDGNIYSEDYLQIGQIPQLKLLKDDILIDLEGDIHVFEDNGMFIVTNLSQTVPIPNDFSLSKAYPNPFNPVTTLNFGIPQETEVFLKIYNLQGREVSTLIDGNMEVGYHSVVWNANSFASGVYFVKMIAGDFVSTQKLMLVK